MAVQEIFVLYILFSNFDKAKMTEAFIAYRDSIKQIFFTNLTWSSSLILHILKESDAISRM